MEYIVFILIGVILIYCISTYNKIIRVENKVKEALSGIDVALSRRYATLTNLVEVVKGYAKHEKEVFTTITKLRSNPTMKDRNDVETNHHEAILKLLALQESYPDLKASEQFLSLQKSIVDLEEHLAASRRMYNANVNIYNNLILTFPSKLIADMLNAREIEYFKASHEEKENIDIILK